MVIAIFFLIAFSVMLLCVNCKSWYAWLFSLVAISLDCLMIAMIFFQGKVLNFVGFFKIDYRIYAYMNGYKIGFYEIVNLVNFGIFLYMVSMWGFIYYIHARKARYSSVAATALSLLPAVGFLIINSSQVCRMAHAWIYGVHAPQSMRIILAVWEFARWLNYAVIIAYVVAPVVCAFWEYKKTKILYNKRRMLVIMTVLCFMDIVYIYIAYQATFELALLNLKNLLKFQDVYADYSMLMYTIVPLVVLLVFQGSIYLFIRFRVFERVDFLRRYTISKKNKLLFEDIRPMLHSYKNVLVSLNFLGRSVVENYGTDEGMEDAREIIAMTNEYCNAMTDLFNLFNTTQINVTEVELCECIKDALRIAVVDKAIEVNVEDAGNGIIVLGDKNHLTKMFENMFQNSVDSMEDVKAPRINVSFICEKDWNCISIRDNGCGIAKKDIKKIFRPLYSTKRASKSWGIGLSYVHKVLQAHNGLIFVASVPDKYTDFQILLPTMKEISIYE